MESRLPFDGDRPETDTFASVTSDGTTFARMFPSIMRNSKAKPTPPRAIAAGRQSGLVVLLLAGVAACSSPATTTGAAAKTEHAKGDLIAANPYGDQTPAQRRAAWLKKDEAPRSTDQL
jgi:hypothetical protein